MNAIVNILMCTLFCIGCNQDNKNKNPDLNKNNSTPYDKISKSETSSKALNDSNKSKIEDTLKINLTDKNKLKQGLWRTYYKTGGLKEEAHYKNNILEGQFNSFYTNGKIEVEGFYKDGKFDGYYKHYYSDGKLEGCIFIKNKQTQTFYRYDKNGKVIFYEIYQNGRPVIIDEDTAIRYRKNSPPGSNQSKP